MTAALASRPGRPAVSTPRNRAIDGRRWLAGGLGLVGRGARLCLHRPLGTITALVFAAATVAIATNALTSQRARHPAPLFGAKSEPIEGVEKRAAAPVPLPPTRPEPAASVPAPPSAPVKASSGRDSIGDLIRGDATGSTAHPGLPEPNRAVAYAQRALTKLGYGPLKADGLMGSGTRLALEKFERERRLPTTGEPAGRTLRELASRSGLPHP